MKKHLWVFAPDLLTANGAISEFLASCKTNGATALRIFAMWTWGRGQTLQPYQVVGEWTHPTTNETFPLYDLTKWNEPYFDRLRTFARCIKEAGLGLVVSVHDNCSLRGDKHTKYWHPFICSKQALKNSPGGVYGSALLPYHKRWCARVVKLLDRVGNEYWIEPVNEFSSLGWTGDTPLVWMQKIITHLKDGLGVPQKRIVHSGEYRDAIAPLVGLYSYHRIVRAEDLPVDTIQRNKAFISGDGGFRGEGCADREGKRGLGLADANIIARRIVAREFTGYEYMCRCLWRRDACNAFLADFDPAPLRAMARIFNT
jgi:hypothetical protein